MRNEKTVHRKTIKITDEIVRTRLADVTQRQQLTPEEQPLLVPQLNSAKQFLFTLKKVQQSPIDHVSVLNEKQLLEARQMAAAKVRRPCLSLHQKQAHSYRMNLDVY